MNRWMHGFRPLYCFRKRAGEENRAKKKKTERAKRKKGKGEWPQNGNDGRKGRKHTSKNAWKGGQKRVEGTGGKKQGQG
jgi:hypothetical protein